MNQLRDERKASEWNIQELLGRLEGDHSFLCELLVMFREDSQVGMDKARAAFGSGDLQELSRAAHSLKGMLRNLSMNAAGESAAALENASGKGMKDESAEQLGHLEQAFLRILPEVEAHLAEVKT